MGHSPECPVTYKTQSLICWYKHVHKCIYRIAGYIGGNSIWRIARKLQLADINLAVTVQSPCLLWESTQLAQYWRIYYWLCDKKSANPANIIPRQYFQLYGSFKWASSFKMVTYTGTVEAACLYKTDGRYTYMYSAVHKVACEPIFVFNVIFWM